MITLHTEDWATNAGILGFYRILRHAGTALYEVKDNRLVFDPALLADFPVWFFDYAMDVFSVARRKEQWVQTCIKRAIGAAFVENKRAIFADMKDTVKRLLNRLPEEVCLIKRLIDQEKQIQSLEELEAIAHMYIELLHHGQLNEVLTFNVIRSRLSDLHGQTSFLQRTRSNISRAEHEAFLLRDFVQPIMWEQQILRTVADGWACLEEEVKRSEKSPYQAYAKAVLGAKKKGTLHFCPMIEGQFALTQYTEMVFFPNAVSLENATNYSWDNKAAFPISRLYRLIMFCTAFGLHKDGDVYLFLQVEEDLRTMLQVNEQYALQKSQGNPFEVFVYDVLRETTDKVKWISQNMMVVEFKNEGKKTMLSQHFVSDVAVAYLRLRQDKELGRMRFYKFRNDVLSRLLRDAPVFPVIVKRLYERLNTVSYGDTYAASLLMFYVTQIKEGSDMSEQRLSAAETRMRLAYKDGQEIRTMYVKRGMENKITGLSYRLLNALSTNNRQQFFETLLRTLPGVQKKTHMYLGPTRPDSTEFETIASAFISGLTDPVKKQEEEMK